MNAAKAHPLFRRPWRELRPLLFGAYVLGPPLVTLLVTPIELLSQQSVVITELAKTAVGVVIGLAIMHVFYAVVLPWTLQPRRRSAREIAFWHGVVLIVVAIGGAELARLTVLGARPALFEFRIQYYRFALVYGGVLMVGLAAYDWMKDEAARRQRERDLAIREAKLAQLEALQIRTNPHFLFNTLNTVACLIELDPTRAIQAVERMSDLYRMILEFSSSSSVTLEQELDVVERYLQIESLRYQQLSYRFEIAEDARKVQVPPLIIQPIVENAIKHGVARAESPGEIAICAERTGMRLSIRVSDAAQTNDAPLHTGAGKSLAIIGERLALAYGAGGRLEHGRRREGGYACEIVIPSGEAA